MSQLVAFYDDTPAVLKGRVELRQDPVTVGSNLRSADGAVRSSLVYVLRHTETGPFLIPFGEYDEWSLRDRYNEAIRIMNTLGAASITCETFQEVTRRRSLTARIRPGGGGGVSQERVVNSGFDFHHEGAGSAPRDPRPLRWPDEPGFAAAVSSVLDNGAVEIAINIKNSRTHAIDGDLGVTLTNLGFQLGANSQHGGATSLHIRAAFPPNRKFWK